ncbi:MAG: hypothetical protein ABJF50_23530 [Paracoccaceae bacterium]
MKRLTLSLSLLLAACATSVQVGSTGPDPNPPAIEGDMPTNEVLVYRPAGQPGLATTVFTRPAIMVNDNNVGDCQVGKPLLIRLPEGRWTVTAITANDRTTEMVDVEDFDTAYFRCGVTGGFAPVPTLVRVTRAVAESEGAV